MQAIGLRTHIWNNAAKTAILLLGFPFLMLIVCYAFTLLWVGVMEDTEVLSGLSRALDLVPTALPIALAASGLWLAFAFFAHQWVIDKLTGARKIDRASEPRLYNLVENLAIQRGLPMPSIRVIDASALNGYASGIRRRHYAITVTRGLLDELDDQELEAVLAHEMTHIINGDVRLIVVAAVFAGLISLVGDLFTQDFARGTRTAIQLGDRSSRSKGKSGGGGIILIFIAIMIFVVARLAATALRLAISRRREFMADAGAVELTKKPDAMIAALRKIERRSSLGAIPGQVEALFIDSDSSGFWATHPSVSERCAALVRYAGGHDPGPRPLGTLEDAYAEQQALQNTKGLESDDERQPREPAQPAGLARNQTQPASDTSAQVVDGLLG